MGNRHWAFHALPLLHFLCPCAHHLAPGDPPVINQQCLPDRHQGACIHQLWAELWVDLRETVCGKVDGFPFVGCSEKQARLQALAVRQQSAVCRGGSRSFGVADCPPLSPHLAITCTLSYHLHFPADLGRQKASCSRAETAQHPRVLVAPHHGADGTAASQGHGDPRSTRCSLTGHLGSLALLILPEE